MNHKLFVFGIFLLILHPACDGKKKEITQELCERHSGGQVH